MRIIRTLLVQRERFSVAVKYPVNCVNEPPKAGETWLLQNSRRAEKHGSAVFDYFYDFVGSILAVFHPPHAFDS